MLPMPKYTDGLGKIVQSKFGGMNASPSAAEGEIEDMKNLTADLWPRIATREKRTSVAAIEHPRGMVWIEGVLHFIEARELYTRNSAAVTQDTPFLNNEIWQKLVVMGSYMAAWPDKVYRYKNPATGTVTYGSMDAVFTIEYGENKGLKFSSEGDSAGGNEITGLQGIGSYVNFAQYLRAGDCITISGCTKHTSNNKSAVIQSIKDDSSHAMLFSDECFELDTVLQHTVPAGGYSILDSITSSMLVIDGFLYRIDFAAAVSEGVVITVDLAAGTVMPSECRLEAGTMGATQVEFVETEEEYTEPCTVTITRQVPSLDFIFEHNNRLMGAKGDTIYISALGDIFNWNKFEGIASDSYTTVTGTQGDFIGGCVYNGHPRFLKENDIFTLYGDYVGQYELSRKQCDGMGCESSSGRSITVCNGKMLWLSQKGVCAYAGGDPVLYGENLGLKYRRYGIGGTDGKKYFLATGNGNDRELFILNGSMWVKNDGMDIMQMTTGEGRCWYMTESGRLGAFGIPEREAPDMARMFQTGNTQEGDVSWYAEFREMTGGTPDKKKITQLQIRLKVDPDAHVSVLIKYDDEAFQTVGTRTTMSETMCIIPLRPRRYDRIVLRVEGTGVVSIESITRTYASGSERRGG